MQNKHWTLARRGRLAALGAACLVALAACKKTDEAAPAAAMTFSRPDAVVMADVVVPYELGGVFVAGQIFDDAGPGSWGWIARIDADGSRLWEKELGKKAQSAYFSAGMPFGEGNVLLAGTVNQGAASTAPASAWLLALTGDGRMLWDKALDFGSRTHALAITTVPGKDDAYLVMGSVRDGDRDAKYRDRAWVVRIDGAGRQSLKKVLESPDTFIPKTVATLADGSFIVAGRALVGPEQIMRGWIGRFAADGRPQWSRALDIEGSDIAAAHADPGDGSIVLAVDDAGEGAVRLMRLDGAGKTLKDGGTTALCGQPALWTTQEGRLQLGGTSCPGAGKEADGIVVPDLAHPDRTQRLAAPPGTKIRRLTGLPGNSEIGVLGERRDGDVSAAVFATRPMP